MEDKDLQKKFSAYIGNNYQIGGTRHYALIDGKSNGCRCIDVRTGSGFDYTIVCDRGMDISLASYKGTNLVHLTENMEANPAFYNSNGEEWLKTFSAGLVTTCGPTNLSSPCTDNGEILGMHGKWSSIPAKQVCDLTDFDSGKIEVSGLLYDSFLFGHKLKIQRKIKSEIGKSWVEIDDVIENQCGTDVPLNVLYHINLGFPFLDESVEIHIPATESVGYDDYSNERIGDIATVKSPDMNNSERNYMHTFEGKNDKAVAWVINRNIDDGLLFYLEFSPKQLPFMTQWFLENIKDFVMAIEPANVPCEPRNILRERGQLPFIAPGEKVNFNVKIGVVAGRENIEKFCKNN